MPLEKGNSKAAVSHNIEKEVAAGKPQAQAVAIALHTAKDDEAKDGILSWAGGARTMSPTVAGGKTLDPKNNGNSKASAVAADTLNAGMHRRAVTPARQQDARSINLERMRQADGVPEEHQKKIEKQNEKMPEPMKNILNPKKAGESVRNAIVRKLTR